MCQFGQKHYRIMHLANKSYNMATSLAKTRFSADSLLSRRGSGGIAPPLTTLGIRSTCNLHAQTLSLPENSFPTYARYLWAGDWMGSTGSLDATERRIITIIAANRVRIPFIVQSVM
jgi:hypothetical protein